MWFRSLSGHNEGSQCCVRCCLHSVMNFNEKMIIRFAKRKENREFNCAHQLTIFFSLYIHSLLRSELNIIDITAVYLTFIFFRFLAVFFSFFSVILIWRLLLSLKCFSVHKTFWCLVTGFRRHCCRSSLLLLSSSSSLLLLCLFFSFFPCGFTQNIHT